MSFFSYKGLNSNPMMLAEKHDIINDNKEIADIRNKYFNDITKNLGLKRGLIHAHNH